MSKALRILAVDDEDLALRRLELLVRRLPGLELCGQARSGAQALAAAERERPDVVLLDIRMGDMSGLDVAEALADQPDPPLVIFITAFDAFAVQAFDLSAVDYVMKPVSLDRLSRAIDRAREKLAGADAKRQATELRSVIAALRTDRSICGAPETTEIWVQRRGEFVRVSADDIDWVEAERDYVHLHAGKERYLLRHTLAGIQTRLGSERFIRVRRSALVRADRVRAIRKAGYGDMRVKLASGVELRVGRTYVQQIRAMLTPGREGA